MYVLGISCFYHDAAAALLKDGQLLAAAEEERFTRKKHDYAFPNDAIEYCMHYAGISHKDLDYVVFYEKPFLKFERVLLTTLHTFPWSYRVFREAMISWLFEKLWIKSLIKDKLNVEDSRILFTEHHLSHAASAFLVSPFEEAAILTVDGVGEWTTASLGVGKGTEIKLTKEIRFPHSIGLLYSAFTAFLGFEVNEGEYKVMGMAPYGKPHYTDKIYKLVRVAQDGSFSLDMDYFCYHYSTHKSFSPRFEGLFGSPRRPDAPFFTAATGYPGYFGDKPSDYEARCKENQYYADIAASIQKVTEEILLNMANSLHRKTGQKRLCMAGGVALNSVANARILKETPFEELYVQPAAGDGGGAVGAAFYAYNCLLNKPRSFVMDHAYWGREYNHEEVRRFLTDNNIPHQYIADEKKLLDTTVEYLLQGKVVGWYQGRFEWGPRALGNRSILADPRREDMKDIVNTKIKFREPFRPFAPSVLSEHVKDFFDLPQAHKHYPARFMLLVVTVKEDKRKIIPAVTHADGTGRLQIVEKDTNPLYYKLIRTFGDKTGVPILLNTSFNLRGEPIVNTPANAFSTFSKSEMDVLVMDRFVVTKESFRI